MIMLPNFFIIGAPKARTSSLHAYLGQHPDVFTCPIKEPNYAPEHERGVIWNDPTIGIDWPLADPELSERDARLPRLEEVIGA